MTVCIAAICEWKKEVLIVGAADRMLTAGDIEFEPPKTKTFSITSHVVALVAGDAMVQATLCRETQKEVLDKPEADVGSIAEIYARHFSKYRLKRSERAILAPLGLDIETFLSRQREMAPEEVARLTNQLHGHRLKVETIIAGVDSTGAHIYIINDPGQAYCSDAIGFAAVGEGMWHAESQFMFAGYVASSSLPKALLLTYQAKKRSEVAPGVGTATDMFIIAHSDEGYVSIYPNVIDEFEKIYKSMTQGIDLASTEAQENLEQYIETLIGDERKESEGSSNNPNAS